MQCARIDLELHWNMIVTSYHVLVWAARLPWLNPGVIHTRILPKSGLYSSSSNVNHIPLTKTREVYYLDRWEDPPLSETIVTANHDGVCGIGPAAASGVELAYQSQGSSEQR